MNLLTHPKSRELTEEESSMMISLLMVENGGEPVPEDQLPAMARIVQQHMTAAGLTATQPFYVMLGVLGDGIPGRAVLWANTCADFAKEHNVKHFTLREVFATRMCPVAVPDEAAYNDCWDHHSGRFKQSC